MSYGQFNIDLANRHALKAWSEKHGLRILSAPHLPCESIEEYARNVGARVVNHPIKPGFVAVVRPEVPEQCLFDDNSEAFAYLCRKMLKVRLRVHACSGGEIAEMPTLLDDDPLQANATGEGWSTVRVPNASFSVFEIAAAMAGVRIYRTPVSDLVFINVSMHQRELGIKKHNTRKPGK